MRMTLTPNLAYASGMDAGNSSMRKAGRKRWNQQDKNTAAQETNRLLGILYPETITFMIRDGLLRETP